MWHSADSAYQANLCFQLSLWPTYWQPPMSKDSMAEGSMGTSH